ncbi:alanine--tRNA ligase [Peptoniphilus sp.]|uniref:alanine--tRNA ligase n=1 Tax=Peptoniphilus sp. TaxID=1971214 RepID=UPI0039966A95
MKNLGLHEIRKEFLEFFKSKDHLILKSFPLIPKQDKSLLLIGAGMAPMKKYFTGELTPPKKRVSTCQKCIRTGDIENVGLTDRHATFFEMLGNFSFGDYFKHEAISWAWEFLTENLEIPKDKLWVTVFYEDEEAYKIWRDEIHVPEERIVKMGKEDNFWELEVGPSGPCSEIYVDRGEEYGCGDPDCKPGCECDRFIEVWNLVFTQFDKDEKGVYHPLAHPNIDTGMGLERIATVLQNTNNIFEIDAIKNIIEKIEELSNYKYQTDKKKDISVRVITDHARAMTFLISDTVRPSNEGRGYVLRRLIRRAARHGRLLGIKRAFLSEIADLIIDSWSVEYNDLVENREKIKEVIRIEEEKFLETIDQGMNILGSYLEELDKENKKILPGDKAFKLYDTYGFPIDLTIEILEDQGYEVDRSGFDENMEEQRRRARESREHDQIGWTSKESEHYYEDLNSEFTGYSDDESDSKIVRIVLDGEIVDSACEGDRAIFVLDKTPFYGEGGGQVGDIGTISSDSFEVEIIDTKKTSKGIVLMVGDVIEGIAKVDSKVHAKIDSKRRNNIRRNHSVTHLLHKALKEVLGTHVNQAGSLVRDDYMRFDFTHFEAISSEDLKKIEEIVNEEIYKALPVDTIITNPEEAAKLGAVGLFEEKYGDIVRVVKMGDFSIELCGGTHVKNTSEIGMFKILQEGGISSGVRRVECITGPAVYKYLNENLAQIDRISKLVKANKSEIEHKIETTQTEFKEAQKEIESIKKDKAKSEIDNVLDSKFEIDEGFGLVYKFENMDVATLRDLADSVKDKLGKAVVVFATINEGKLNFVAATSNEISKKYNAGNIVREVAKICGGSGGGRPTMATAGASDLIKVDEALDFAKELLTK